MNEQKSIGEVFDYILKDINSDIEKMYSNSYKNKWIVLEHLKDRITILEKLIKSINDVYNLRIPAVLKQDQDKPGREVNILKTFTIDELARFNGKNGNPVYVAVDKIVYDVTNNAAWAAATHFGLSAVKDLTSEFLSHHADKTVLNKLPVVGNLT